MSYDRNGAGTAAPGLRARDHQRGARATARLAALAILAAGIPASAAAKGPMHIAAVEVTTKKPIDSATLIDGLKHDVMAEAAWYEKTGTPVTMRIRIDNMKFRSAGKEVIGAIPVVGLFAGENVNLLRGAVELVEPGSGRVLKKFKLEADDKAGFDVGGFAADTASGLLSFIPGVGMLAGEAATLAMGVGRSAGGKRDVLEAKMSANFAGYAILETFGRKATRAARARKKAAQSAAPAAAPAVIASEAAPSTAVAEKALQSVAAPSAAQPATAAPAAIAPTLSSEPPAAGIEPNGTEPAPAPPAAPVPLGSLTE
jgi:hypothetical protein